jgi:outer membrane protein assembly factor BamE (lipoprotein component of BamABCDE complex)
VKKILIVVMATALLLSGCMTAGQHRQSVQDGSDDRMTVGKVQREVRVGMSGAEVAQVLGSPNIVSTDEQRREVWIYDKISTDTAYSTSSGGVSALILGWGGSIAGGAAPGYSQGSGAASKSQRTLTVIIKFDEDKKVRDFAYHTSRF